jgi:hypothetical protein
MEDKEEVKCDVCGVKIKHPCLEEESEEVSENEES